MWNYDLDVVIPLRLLGPRFKIASFWNTNDVNFDMRYDIGRNLIPNMMSNPTSTHKSDNDPK